ncbi:MAG: hypothetical protein DRJ97_05855 [Thermoprotei archaeon]|nr:MAG: hypothetical protein DRJ97_05855 [Thermoprotei archaeon]
MRSKALALTIALVLILELLVAPSLSVKAGRSYDEKVLPLEPFVLKIPVQRLEGEELIVKVEPVDEATKALCVVRGAKEPPWTCSCRVEGGHVKSCVMAAKPLEGLAFYDLPLKYRVETTDGELVKEGYAVVRVCGAKLVMGPDIPGERVAITMISKKVPVVKTRTETYYEEETRTKRFEQLAEYWKYRYEKVGEKEEKEQRTFPVERRVYEYVEKWDYVTEVVVKVHKSYVVGRWGPFTWTTEIHYYPPEQPPAGMVEAARRALAGYPFYGIPVTFVYKKWTGWLGEKYTWYAVASKHLHTRKVFKGYEWKLKKAEPLPPPSDNWKPTDKTYEEVKVEHPLIPGTKKTVTVYRVYEKTIKKPIYDWVLKEHKVYSKPENAKVIGSRTETEEEGIVRIVKRYETYEVEYKVKVPRTRTVRYTEWVTVKEFKVKRLRGLPSRAKCLEALFTKSGEKIIAVKFKPSVGYRGAAFKALVLWRDDETPVKGRAGRLMVVVRCGMYGDYHAVVNDEGEAKVGLPYNLDPSKVKRIKAFIAFREPFGKLGMSIHLDKEGLEVCELATIVEYNRGGLLKVKVVEYDDYSPIKGATVYLLKDGREYAWRTTDASARAEFTLPGDGRLELKVIPPEEPTLYIAGELANILIRA